jgi:type III restriction enzyme
MQLKDYQETAITKLLTRSKELLAQSGEKKIIFKAPTGSGKTIMMAEFLKRMVDDAEIKIPLAFIWTAPRKLHTQSKGKLVKYFDTTRAIECSDFEELTDKQIGENEILFLNWESINKKDKNTIVKENEKEFYLGKIVENTKAEEREIILVIDESHHHATSEISQSLISDIGPRLTIEVSATPVIQDPDEIVSVPLEDVKLEGMIKKSVLLNPNFKNVLSGDNITSTLADGTDMMVLEEALKKRAELVKAYQDSGINVNPLLLIQLPVDMCKKVKYQQEDKTLGIKSLSPTKIIGAEKVLLYNTQSAKATIIEANSSHGLSIKGSTIIDFDSSISKSYTKKIRKPAEFMKEIKDKGIRAVKSSLDSIKTSSYECSGRINEDTIILGVY